MGTRIVSRLGLCCVAVYLIAIAGLFLTIRKQEAGHFVYALDDAYIHLAMAENLAHGHYGINPAEYSSPSSSLLWPFLLIPFAGTSFHVYTPLVWNLLFGASAAFLLGWVIERWPPQADRTGHMGFLQKLTTAMLLMFAANLFSLTMVGMEHVLQVLLSICCAIAIVEVLSGREVPLWCLLAAGLAPSVRYEGVGLTLAVAVALAARRRWTAALALFSISLVPLIAFSAFLTSRGMPALPMSVLSKGGVYNGGTAMYRMYLQLRTNIYQTLVQPNHFAVAVFFCMFAALAWKEKDRVRRYVFGAAAFLALMQCLVGRFGWFNRYEVYAVIFLLLVALRVLAERPPFTFAFYTLALLACAGPYIAGTSQVVRASLDIYRQQYQMHRFLTQYFDGSSYAVNDLGLASYQRRPGTYVLDVYGLGSVEALQARDKSAAWMDHAVRVHGASLAILYPDWFHIPGSWTSVARLCEPEAIVSHDRCVVFFSTTAEATERIRAELAEFAKTLPKEDVLEFSPSAGLGPS